MARCRRHVTSLPWIRGDRVCATPDRLLLKGSCCCMRHVMCQSRQESRALEGLGGDGQEVNQGNEET